MYVTSVSLNDTRAETEETYQGQQINAGLIEDLIRRLDGARHTTVVLHGGDGASLSVGGRAGEGLVVFQTRDSAYHFLSGTHIVSLAAGNQRDRGHLVDVDRAIKAARTFAVNGTLADDLIWQTF
jgi:lipid-binding SYLF domain-containing protein